MSRFPGSRFTIPTRAMGRALGLALLLAVCGAPNARADAATPPGKIQGRLVSIDSGDPVGFADVILVPADTTMRRVGGLTNADGTFLLEAAPGRYALQIRALSYARKRIEGILIESGKVLPFSTGLSSEAIRQEEIVVEARARQNTESSMLSARRKAATVGDAVSAEQVRKSPDKDAAEVLRRVTGLSVSDGKYVFVRGLGERYSSTEVDGVRIASPEENKRVVPLDLLPANLLENIVVQKTYSADRAGEFGGGDVQVHTKDFPGKRTWSFSASQSVAEHVTFHHRLTYHGARQNGLGFSADGRSLPGLLGTLFPGRMVPDVPRPGAQPKPGASNVALSRSFSDVWSSVPGYTSPNSSYSATYGDERKVFGRSLGMITSMSMSRSFDDELRSHRSFTDVRDTLVDYPTRISTASAQAGGLAGVSLRLSPRHAVHARGFYTSSADDEVRTYEGYDHTRTEAVSQQWLQHRSTRLKYVERNIVSGSLEGQHEFSHLFGTALNWKLSRSEANRLQPDMREVVYDNLYWDDGAGPVGHWALEPRVTREFGDLKDRSWGTDFSGTVPLGLGRMGKGKVSAGYTRDLKKRTNNYRRFAMVPNANANTLADPETIFSPASFDTLPGSGYVSEFTYNDATFSDNYVADQNVSATFATLDLPLGRPLRLNLGVRSEHGHQAVRGYKLFQPDVTLQRGEFASTDLLPSANLTWSVTPTLSARFAASRTLSRPDLNELSPSPQATYVNDFTVIGNPKLRRFTIDNYDVRLEVFPSLSEVIAIGGFYKSLHHPIERALRADVLRSLEPYNTGEGYDRGVEVEMRTSLRRAWRRLEHIALNSNASFISSQVDVFEISKNLGTGVHPLQGQANYLVNTALSWTSGGGGTDLSVLVTAAGKRLKLLGFTPLPDIYEQPTTTLDATLNWTPFPRARLKLAAKNILDRPVETLQGSRQAESYRMGRAFSAAFTLGS